jgi:hypothetical protein
MKHTHKVSEVGKISEMAIVDTFTKLIFGEDKPYSSQELLIIQALRMVDTNVVFDSHRVMGQYLRALGVGEMVQLVSRVQRQMREQAPPILDGASGEPARDSALDRRAH